MSGFPAPLPEIRVWKRIEKGPENACWMWQGVVNKGGYGVIQFGAARNRSSTTAHRAVYASLHGGLPCLSPDDVVMHTCDEPRCCNPAHLALGTAQLNMMDCIEKGRSAKAHRFGGRLRKLTDDDVRAIRRLGAEGKRSWEIAPLFGVGENHVGNILAGKRKAHVPNEAPEPVERPQEPSKRGYGKRKRTSRSVIA